MSEWGRETQLATIIRQQEPLSRTATLVRNHGLQDGIQRPVLQARPESLHFVPDAPVGRDVGDHDGAFELRLGWDFVSYCEGVNLDDEIEIEMGR